MPSPPAPYMKLAESPPKGRADEHLVVNLERLKQSPPPPQKAMPTLTGPQPAAGGQPPKFAADARWLMRPGTQRDLNMQVSRGKKRLSGFRGIAGEKLGPVPDTPVAPTMTEVVTQAEVEPVPQPRERKALSGRPMLLQAWCNDEWALPYPPVVVRTCGDATELRERLAQHFQLDPLTVRLHDSYTTVT